MAYQQRSRWDNIANDPSMTLTSGNLYQNAGREQTHQGMPSYPSRFDVVTPGPPAARSVNEASGSYRAVQAASTRLQSGLHGGTRTPGTEYVLGGQASRRQQYHNCPFSWGDYLSQFQNDGVQRHVQTGFQPVSYLHNNVIAYQLPYSPHPRPLYHQGHYLSNCLEDDIYHHRDPSAKTLEDFSHVRSVYSRDRSEHYHLYDGQYYYGDLRTWSHCSEGL